MRGTMHYDTVPAVHAFVPLRFLWLRFQKGCNGHRSVVHLALNRQSEPPAKVRQLLQGKRAYLTLGDFCDTAGDHAAGIIGSDLSRARARRIAEAYASNHLIERLVPKLCVGGKAVGTADVPIRWPAPEETHYLVNGVRCTSHCYVLRECGRCVSTDSRLAMDSAVAVSRRAATNRGCSEGAASRLDRRRQRSPRSGGTGARQRYQRASAYSFCPLRFT
jgi:hypothetical protein